MDELLLALLSGLVQFVAEILVNVALEIVLEILGRALKEPLRKPEHMDPAPAALGYLVYGALGGGLSLLLFPRHFVHAGLLRAACLLVVPLVSGLLMGAIGAYRHRREKEVIRIESFFYAFVFALAVAVVRLIWAH